MRLHYKSTYTVRWINASRDY